MLTSAAIIRLGDSLIKTREYLLATQRQDGTWTGRVTSDPRITAFYMITHRSLGRSADDRTREMELYLSSKQLGCGSWQAWPGGEPDVDVTATCVLALEIADTERGLLARKLGQVWLSRQPLPVGDSFWQGFLAVNGYVDWADLPYLTTRLITNPKWMALFASGVDANLGMQ